MLGSSLLYATDNTEANKQLRLQMEKEKQISQTQTFQKGKDYDLKSQEVSSSSLNTSKLESTPELLEADDDFNMDDVY